MKKIFLFLVAFLVAASVVFSSSLVSSETDRMTASAERVSFKIKGTGSKNIPVTIGIGSQPGSGACCSGVSPFTTASFVGNVGEVVYDGKTRRVITKISRDMNGTTLDLSQYY
jgi:archaellum component FlaG (FlaF/FlaG flagellin family)